MSSREFEFILSLPDSKSPALVRDLVAEICTVASYPPDRTEDLVHEVEAAVAKAAAFGPCEVRFHAQDGALDVRVRAGAHQVWQTAHPIT